MNVPLSNFFNFFTFCRFMWNLNEGSTFCSKVLMKSSEQSRSMRLPITWREPSFEGLRSVAKCKNATPFWSNSLILPVQLSWLDSFEEVPLIPLYRNLGRENKRFFGLRKLYPVQSSRCSFTRCLGAFQWIDLHNVYLQHKDAYKRRQCLTENHIQYIKNKNIEILWNIEICNVHNWLVYIINLY